MRVRQETETEMLMKHQGNMHDQLYDKKVEVERLKALQEREQNRKKVMEGRKKESIN